MQLRSRGRDASEVDVKPDGSWRVKNAAESGLGAWHSPDGTVQALSNAESNLGWDSLQAKEEEGLGGREEIILGTKRPRNGIHKVNPRQEDLMRPPLFYGNVPKFESPGDMIMPIYDSLPRGGVPVDFSGEGQRPDPAHFGVVYDVDQAPPARAAHPEVIVLSDSDDDDIPSLPLDAGYGAADPFMAADSEPQEPCPVDPDLGVDPVPSLDHFSGGVDFEKLFWPLPASSQTGSGFQFFSADSEASFLPINSYGLPASQPASEANHGLPAFVGDDPSMQMFLASRPNDHPRNSPPRHNFSDGSQPDSWISLRLGLDDGSSPFGARSGIFFFLFLIWLPFLTGWVIYILLFMFVDLPCSWLQLLRRRHLVRTAVDPTEHPFEDRGPAGHGFIYR